MFPADEACTLPTAERPLRLAEFDDLIATAVRDRQRRSPTSLRWRLDPAAGARARDLAARESRCCTFFTFTFTAGDGQLWLDITVPPAHTGVLDALTGRSDERAGLMSGRVW